MATPNFVNRTVWTGDNLDVLRGINSECVDLIYLDPPFNSNKNYSAPIGSEAAGAAFKDTWNLDDVDEAWHGEIADRDPALYSVIGAARLAHGPGMQSYLTMMAVRLLELKRVLKPTGSIYLHCDPTASHYLKLLMDVVFGVQNFRNEIVWKRTGAHGDSKSYGRISDHLLFYGTGRINKDAVRMPLNPEYVRKKYRYRDARGLFREAPLTAKGLSGGGYHYDFHGHPGPWRYPEARMRGLETEGRIYIPKKKGGVPAFKRYLADNKGQPPLNIWTDIPPVNSQAKERTGYPTQKPLALLERIIKASSTEGALILDPFGGCATALVAAETLNRQWAGIDLSPLAVKLVDQRLRDQHGAFGQIVARTDIPKRTDFGKLPNYRTHRHSLYGRQEGHCNGCLVHFPFRNMTVDHIVPQSKGGTDHLDNLQLLCGACNSKKGTASQPELVAMLVREGIRK